MTPLDPVQSTQEAHTQLDPDFLRQTASLIHFKLKAVELSSRPNASNLHKLHQTPPPGPAKQAPCQGLPTRSRGNDHHDDGDDLYDEYTICMFVVIVKCAFGLPESLQETGVSIMWDSFPN